MEIVGEIFKYTIPSLVVFAVSYFTLRLYMSKQLEAQKLELQLENSRDSRPVRLQAYERVALLLERLAFANLLHRVRRQDQNVRDFQMALLANIRAEFEHNMAQQIYVSTELWGAVKSAKEESISIINQVAAAVPPEAPSIELSKRVFAYMMDREQLPPSERALLILKKEIVSQF